MRRRFWLGIAAVTLVALGSLLAAFFVYSDDRSDFDRRQHDEATRAAHQMEAVAALSVDQLTSAAAFFRAEDRAQRDEGDGGNAEPEAAPHEGTAARDSQR